MLKNTTLFCLLWNITYFFAQQNTYEISGVVVDESSRQPIPFATVVEGENSTQVPITGVTTTDDGSFFVISPSQEVYIEISFIGYDTFRKDNITLNNQAIDLGLILLNEKSQILNEVEVRGEKIHNRV